MRQDVASRVRVLSHRPRWPVAGAAVNECPCTKLYRAYFATKAGLDAFRKLALSSNKRIVSIGYGDDSTYYVRWACK